VTDPTTEATALVEATPRHRTLAGEFVDTWCAENVRATARLSETAYGDLIARAADLIAAAEQRGREAERERCADIVRFGANEGPVGCTQRECMLASIEEGDRRPGGPDGE
jgi:hypothetical protein